MTFAQSNNNPNNQQQQQQQSQQQSQNIKADFKERHHIAVIGDQVSTCIG